MSFFKRLTLFIGSLAILFTVAGGILTPVYTVHAQVEDLQEVGDVSGLGDEDVRIVVARLIRYTLTFLGIIAVVIVLYGGFVWMTAGGDSTKVDKAKKILINGAIGLAIILASWSITTFVLNTLLNATSGTGGTSSSSSSDYSGSYGGSYTASFVVNGFSPEGETAIRNIVARITFSRQVDEETVEGNIVITNTETGDEVDGTLSVSGSAISFTPDQPCPSPHEDRYCFDENTNYTVTVHDDIESTAGTSLNCSASSCVSEFTAGDLIDVEDPEVTVTYPESGRNISADSSSLVQATVTDDSQVSTADFYAGDDWFDTVAASGDDLSDVSIESTWYTDDTEEGTRYTLEVTAFDIAGNEDSDSTRIIILPSHCFDEVLSGDEDLVDCGGSCGSCGGDSCVEDSDCSSGECEDGTCVTYPEIESVAPSNGAVGTYVTISGTGFGYSGSVYFTGADDVLIVASIPSCADGWSPIEIIVEVPDGAVDGPITLITSDDYTETTDDDNGALIDDFIVNEVVRPNLCNVTPDRGLIGEGLVLTGSNFGDTQDDSFVYFDPYIYFDDIDAVEASSYSSWADGGVSVTVPSLTQGDYVDISITVDGVTSNSIAFGVEYSTADSAVIYDIDPSEGGIGQYVTISGANFGSSTGSVWFVDDASGYTAQGSVDFPDECEGDYWDSDEIIVKVPSTYTNGNDVEPGDFTVYIDPVVGGDSDTVDFEITSAAPTPGICAIDPSTADVGDTVILYGENFGSSGGSLDFYGGATADLSSTSWSDESISALVPSGTLTGEVIITSSAGDESNGVSFEVGEAADVAVGPVGAGYAWLFATGEIPDVPTVLVECSDDLVSAVPNILYTQDACTEAVVRATFSTLMDESTINTESIRVYECESSNCTVDTDDDDSIASSGVSVSSSSTQTSFIWQADSSYNDGTFKTDTSYLVLVTDDARAYADSGFGETLASDATWTFTTGGELDCDVEEVMVSPTSATIVELNDESEFNALPLHQCQVLDPVEFDWDWDIDTGSYIGLTDCESITDDYCVSAIGYAEGATVLTAEEEDSNTSGDAEVIVDFTDPYVSDYSPNCDTACVNGAITVSFNTTMDTSVENEIELYSCINELCAQLDLVETLADCSEVEGCSEVSLTLDDDDYGTELDESAFYRVIVSGSAVSTSGVPLTRTNYGDDFSWVFGTKDDEALCLMSRIALSPENEVLDSIGATQYYEVSAYGDPDSCSVAGQALNGYSYDWEWTDPIVDDEGVAEWVKISSSLFDSGQSSIPSGCSSMCLASGSEVYYGVCGNGVIETGEDCDDGNGVDDDGCSSSCLSEGASACTYSCSSTGDSCAEDSECQETCVILEGESEGLCSISSDTCEFDNDCPYYSSTCDQNDASCCGDGVLDQDATTKAGEECDDGNSVDGDGCSSMCLNEGSAFVGTTCGNGDRAYDAEEGGEDCDDGNASSGDGCSSVCLNEGTPTQSDVPAECGDGTITEPYETCDDGNSVDGDGCSSSCLREGASADYDAGGIAGECGDGYINKNEYEGGEDCDGDEEGCSDDCLWEGSSINYTDPSVCGDGVLGTGELDVCEGGGAGPDEKIDPIQLVSITDEAAVLVDEDTQLATATIEVSYLDTDLSASTSLYLSCSAERDSDCEDGKGPATTGCCMDRPDPEMYPNGEDACINAEIYAIFDMEMDLDTFADNVYVELDLSSGDIEGNCPLTHSTVALNLEARSLWQKVVDVFTRIFAPKIYAQSTGDCVVPLTGFTQALTEDNRYKVSFTHDVALEALAEYWIHIDGDVLDDDDNDRDGILTSYGVAMDGDSAQQFTTNDGFCELDEVVVTDTYTDSLNVFTAQGEKHDFYATAYSYDTGEAQSISPMDEYDWDWQAWASDDEAVIEVDSETVGDVVTPLASLMAAGATGEANITSAAVITSDTTGESFYCTHDTTAYCTIGDDSECQDVCSDNVCSVSGDSCEVTEDCEYAASICESHSVSGTEDLTAIVCENPWPSVEAFPFEDSADGVHSGVSTSATRGVSWFNFSTYYCRDAGDDGDEDDYSELRVVMAAERGSDDTLKEYFFNVYDGTHSIGEAIGIRIIKNESYLSPLAWYEANGFSGSPSETTVDGFQAVEDGRSIYVAVPNHVSGTIYPNIVIISYSYGASTETVDIYNMLLENMSFVTNLEDTAICYNRGIASNPAIECSSDLDCTEPGYRCASDKLKVMRDMDRLGDITDLASSVSIASPQIESGSFVRSLSSSVWGSWDDVLASELGESVDSDPIDSYLSCGDPGRFSDYDAETCVNETTGEYICPLGSRSYHYRAFGGTGYVLSAELEFGRGAWAYDIDTNLDNDNYILIGGYGGDGFENGPAFCDGVTVWGSSDICGDGIVGSAEICEAGDIGSSTTTCDSDGDGVNDGYLATQCNTECSAYDDTEICVATSCGNGVIESGEDCDDGTLNGSYGYCGADCSNDTRTYCGDGTLAGGEACDCGVSGTASGVAYGGGMCLYLNGVYTRSGSSACAWDCSGPGPYCGDRQVDDAEECDGNTETYSGKYCIDSSENPGGECTVDEDCPDPVFFDQGRLGQCGEDDSSDITADTANECPLTTVCVDGDSSIAGEPCRVDSDCNSTDATDGVCSVLSYQTTRTRVCNDRNCTWVGDWSDVTCIAPGSCGDGIVDDGEECDDGNDDSTDSCTVECTNNYCGDGYIYAGEESCDEGDQNGVLCEASYESTCTYCNANCVSVSSSGSFCGDGVMDADEACDADDIPYYYYSAADGLGETCESGDAQDEDGRTCLSMGICEGGTNDGDYCTTLFAMCSGGGACVEPSCDSSCDSMCPFTYDAASVAIKTNELGASRGYSADIAPFNRESSVMSTGNSSTLYVPACSVSESLQMSLSDDDREYPDVEIMLVLDKSNSMDYCIEDASYPCTDGTPRIDVLRGVVADAISSLYEAYDSATTSTMSVGWAYISGQHDLDGTKSFLQLSPTATEGDVQADITSYLDTGDANGTPIYQSIEDAYAAFSGTAEVEYMVIFTDGDIQNHDYEDLDASIIPRTVYTGSGIDEEDYMVAVSDLIDDIQDDGVFVYTAALASNSCDISQMQRWSSMDCEDNGLDSCEDQRAEGNYACVNPDDGVTYAYSATDADGLADMYDEIVNSILNITVSLTFDDETVSTTVEPGLNQSVDLPSTFVCDESTEQSITLRTTFNGSGTVELSDIDMNMCAE